jgi:hypothetical protein
LEISHPFNPTVPECNGCSRETLVESTDSILFPSKEGLFQLDGGGVVNLSEQPERRVCSAYGWPGTWFRNGKRCPLGDHYPKEAPQKKAFINPLKLSKMREKGLI